MCEEQHLGSALLSIDGSKRAMTIILGIAAAPLANQLHVQLLTPTQSITSRQYTSRNTYAMLSFASTGDYNLLDYDTHR